jgi:hypothetical protein
VQRAFLIVLIPALVVGIFYVAVFRGLGLGLSPLPFLGAAAALAAGLIGVRRYQRRKQEKRRI